jgi:hypothetical protein
MKKEQLIKNKKEGFKLYIFITVFSKTGRIAGNGRKSRKPVERLISSVS